MNNGDKIREMDNEELADFLDNLTYNCARGYCFDCEMYDIEKCCRIYAWLESEAQDEE